MYNVKTSGYLLTQVAHIWHMFSTCPKEKKNKKQIFIFPVTDQNDLSLSRYFKTLADRITMILIWNMADHFTKQAVAQHSCPNLIILLPNMYKWQPTGHANLTCHIVKHWPIERIYISHQASKLYFVPVNTASSISRLLAYRFQQHFGNMTWEYKLCSSALEEVRGEQSRCNRDGSRKLTMRTPMKNCFKWRLRGQRNNPPRWGATEPEHASTARDTTKHTAFGKEAWLRFVISVLLNCWNCYFFCPDC